MIDMCFNSDKPNVYELYFRTLWNFPRFIFKYENQKLTFLGFNMQPDKVLETF